MKITIVAGARPNFMKIAPIVRAVDNAMSQGKNISYRLVYTGTKEDSSIDASLFSDLHICEPHSYLNVNSNNATLLASGIMVAFDKELTENPAHVVLVVDDLTATMSCAIVAKKQGVKVAHLVAGTRSFDLNMPKEINRMISDGLSDYLFTASITANRNLNQTGTEEAHVYHVGNILIDNIRYHCKRFIKPIWFDTLNITNKNYLLLTLNRRVLLNDTHTIKALLETIIKEANGCPIIAPVHNYVREAIIHTGISAPNLYLLPPQGYLSFGYLMSNAKGVITDSGNIAEETTFLGVPCITLNDYAEHPETWRIGTNELVGENTEQLAKAINKLIAGEWKKGELPERWDGRTAERIVQILLG